jgi:ligand-binding sensor domain-containing protein
VNNNNRILFFFFYFFFFTGVIYSQEYATRLYTPQKDGLIQSQVFCITKGPEGKLWIGTLGGMSCFDGLIFTNYTEDEGLLSNAVFDMQWWNDTLFIVTKEGISCMTGGKISTLFFDKKIKFKNPKIKINKKYRYVIAHNYDYLFILNLKTNVVTRFHSGYNNNDMLGAALTDSSILLSNKNKLYELPYSDVLQKNWKPEFLYSFKGDIYIVNVTRKRILVNYERSPEGINHQFFCLERSKDKKELVRTDSYELINDDVNRISLTKTGKVFLYGFSGNIYFQENGCAFKLQGNYNFINGSFEDENGILWVATEKGVLKIFNGKFRYYYSENGYPNNVWAAGKLNDSLLLMASFNNGIHIFYNDGKEKKIRKFTGSQIISCNFGLCRGFKNDYLLSITPGVASYDIITNSVNVIDDKMTYPSLTLYKDNKKKRVLVANLHRLAALYEGYTTDSLFNVEDLGVSNMIISLGVINNKILLGLTKGLVEFNPETKKAKLFYDTIRFNSLVVDSNNTIWAATSEGIMHIAGDSVGFIKRVIKPKEITSLILDNHNRLFASGQTTLYILDLKKYYLQDRDYLSEYGIYDGYFGDGPQQDAFFKDDDGNLWLPTGYNVIKIIPGEFNQSEETLETIITRMSISGNDTTSFLVDINDKIEIPYDKNRIKFCFSSVNLNNPERTRYYYLLESNNDRWSDEQKSREVSFKSLPPGKYRFSIKASADNSFDKAPATTINFTILPPFWQTGWFYLLIFVVFVLVVLLIIKIVKARERKKLRIETELTNLKTLALSTQIDHHFLANCTSKIVILYESGKMEEANRYTRTFSDFLRRNLMYLRSDKISLKEEILLVEQYVELERKYGKDFDFKVKTGSNIDLEKIMIFPFMIQPIVENAIKHGVKKLKSGDGQIHLTVTKPGNYVLIVIYDNGSGLNNDNNMIASGNGASLKIVKERLALFGKGSGIYVDSSDAGTTVTLTISNI